MSHFFKLNTIDFPYKFELDETGYIWLHDYESNGSRTNLGQVNGVKNIENAKKNALEMIYSMGLIKGD